MHIQRFGSVKGVNHAMSWNTWDILTTLFPVWCVFWRNNMASKVENASWNPWKCHFSDSKFQNVPSFLDPQELVPLVRVPKPPAIHYQPSQCYLKNCLTALVNLSFHTGLSKNAVLKFVHLAILLLVNVVFSFWSEFFRWSVWHIEPLTSSKVPKSFEPFKQGHTHTGTNLLLSFSS